MRGRILWAMIITAAVLSACSRKDSLYIEPGKAGPAKAPRAEPVKAPAAKIAAPARKP
jgi:hypothetical protein